LRQQLCHVVLVLRLQAGSSSMCKQQEQQQQQSLAKGADTDNNMGQTELL
jgi:hypothetical protein